MKLFNFGSRRSKEAEFTSSTATFLCARPGHYTAQAEQDHVAAFQAVVRIEEHIARCVVAEGGRMLNAFNASFCAMFASAPAALKAAIRIAPGTRTEDYTQWSLSVMCGLHTGLVYSGRGRIFSSSIGTAEWVSTRGNGGQIFVSQTTEAMLRPHLGTGWALKKCSDNLKGTGWYDFYMLMTAEDYAREHRAAFISYRRGGGSELARLVASELRQREVDTFIDLDDLDASYFDEQIIQRIGNTPNFVLILTPGCMDRCNEEGDWLRREIACALRTGRNIIPVMAREFQFPSAQDLPEELRELPRHNGVPYSHEYAGAAVGRIMDFLTAAQAP
jgi:hypothetical protein